MITMPTVGVNAASRPAFFTYSVTSVFERTLIENPHFLN